MNSPEIKDCLGLPSSPAPGVSKTEPREPWSSKKERSSQKIVPCVYISVNNSYLGKYTGMLLKSISLLQLVGRETFKVHIYLRKTPYDFILV